MRRRDKPLDIYKKLQIVRAMEHLIVEEDGSTLTGLPEKGSGELENMKTSGTKKKKLNIPVGDVKLDPTYNTIISADFVVPQSYVRHTKKIGDEEDPTIDYCLEDDDKEWITTHPTFGAENQSVMIELVEKIFNLLERHTGTGDPVDMMTSEKLLTQLVVWKSKPASLANCLPEIYQRWIFKRNLLHRPLCRRYWPQTSPSDTNPHNVFRPREKERYRLRKHRKNDLHSFRKLQSLRRELGKARILLQLVVERELMKQAQLDLQSRIFECRLECARNDDSEDEAGVDEESRATEDETEKDENGEKKEDPISQYRYRPRYEHLMPVKDQDMATTPYLDERDKESSGLRFTLSMRNQSMSLDGFKKQSGRPRKRDSSAMEGSDFNSPPPPPIAPIASVAPPPPPPRQRQRTSHGHSSSSLRGEAASLPVSPWPSFMEPLHSRQPLFVCRNMSSYMRELELSTDQTPIKFRCRGRVGRGGRVVMDRIPIYNSQTDQLTRENYFFPSQLSSLSSQLTHQRLAELFSNTNSSSSSSFPYSYSLSSSSSMDQMVLSLRHTGHNFSTAYNRNELTNDQLDEVNCLRSSFSSLTSYPFLFPPERTAISSIATPEEREIYLNSDSEDELVEIHHTGTPYPPVSKIVDRSAVKYSFLDV